MKKVKDIKIELQNELTQLNAGSEYLLNVSLHADLTASDIENMKAVISSLRYHLEKIDRLRESIKEPGFIG